MPMRKLCLLLLASLFLLPAVALAEGTASNGGSLVVSDANGKLIVTGHGLIFGHLDRGIHWQLRCRNPCSLLKASPFEAGWFDFTG